MPLEALIFDVDGTLAETEEAHRKSFNEAFAAFGLDWIWDKELYRELLQVTGGKERLRHYIDGWKPRGSEAALARFAGIYEEKSARYTALVASGAAPERPGVRRLITEAHERGVQNSPLPRRRCWEVSKRSCALYSAKKVPPGSRRSPPGML